MGDFNVEEGATDVDVVANFSANVDNVELDFVAGGEYIDEDGNIITLDSESIEENLAALEVSDVWDGNLLTYSGNMESIDIAIKTKITSYTTSNYLDLNATASAFWSFVNFPFYSAQESYIYEPVGWYDTADTTDFGEMLWIGDGFKRYRQCKIILRNDPSKIRK